MSGFVTDRPMGAGVKSSVLAGERTNNMKRDS
jgi:hypothetical protein